MNNFNYNTFVCYMFFVHTSFMYKTRKKKTDPKQKIRNGEKEIGCLYIYKKEREREKENRSQCM